MAIEAKQILEYLGIPEAEITDLDKFKEKFSDEETGFVPAKTVKENVKKTFVNLKRATVGVGKKYAPDLSWGVVEGLPVEKMLETILETQAKQNLEMVTSLTAKNTELEGTVGKKKDEVVKEWEGKYSQLESKYKDTEKLLAGTAAEFETFKKTSAEQFKGVKLSVKKGELMKGLKLKSTITDLEKAGFNSLIDSKYKFDLDEHDEIYVADAKTGERLKSTAKAGAFKTPDEVLTEEAIQQKVYAVQEKPRFGYPAPNTPPAQIQQPATPMNGNVTPMTRQSVVPRV